MRQKTFFIFFKKFSLKQLKPTFQEVESPTLRYLAARETTFTFTR